MCSLRNFQSSTVCVCVCVRYTLILAGVCGHVSRGWRNALSCKGMVLDGGRVIFFPWMIILPVGKTTGLLRNILAFSSSLLSVPSSSSLQPPPSSRPAPSLRAETVLRQDRTRRRGLIGSAWRIDRPVWGGASSARWSSSFNHKRCRLKMAVEQGRTIELRQQPAAGICLCWCVRMLGPLFFGRIQLWEWKSANLGNIKIMLNWLLPVVKGLYDRPLNLLH